MPAPSLVVFGGAGYLGSSISKAAISKGWQVTSISRKGRPAKSSAWHDKVNWVKGDAFKSESFSEALASADHVAHTIGVLDYRGFMTEPKISKAIDKVGNTVYDAFREIIPSTSPSSDELQIYDRLNREAAMSVSMEATKYKNLKSFVYISAAAEFPGISQRYITTKREAENYIMGLQDKSFRSIIFRPGFMFSDDRAFTKPVGRLLGLSYALNSSLSGRIPGIGAAGVKPLAVERVGSAVVEACDNEQIDGVVDIHQIEALADVRWRAEMIV